MLSVHLLDSDDPKWGIQITGPRDPPSFPLRGNRMNIGDQITGLQEWSVGRFWSEPSWIYEETWTNPTNIDSIRTIG